MEKILVTGASGFIGSFVTEEALRRGMEVWAGVRPTSSRKYLQDKRIRFIELDFGNPEELTRQLQGHGFNYVVHAAGVTKSLHRDEFFRTNTEGTKNLAMAMIKLQMPVKKFIYISSLSVFGPVREQQPYREILENDNPHPNTAYGESKLQAEKWLASTGNLTAPFSPFPYIILRPTGVYGPRERDYLLMAKSVKKHMDFAVGYKRQDITFIYVKDVVQAVFLAIEHGRAGRKYFLSDGNVYQSSKFSKLIRKELGSPWCIHLTVPIWLLRVVTSFGEYTGRRKGKISALNNDKYNIMKQRNWRCDITPAIQELGFKPQYDLERGVKETVSWYKKNHWL